MTSPMTSENGPVEDFSVLGATANVYSVTVGKHPNCTCPDFQRGNLCKHYLFVMLRVLRLDRSDPLVWQKALLKAEVHVTLSLKLQASVCAQLRHDGCIASAFAPACRNGRILC